jgi:hypothetical protein
MRPEAAAVWAHVSGGVPRGGVSESGAVSEEGGRFASKCMLQLFGNRVSSQLLENMELICGVERVGSRFRDHFVSPENMVTHLLSLVVVEIFIVNTRQGSFEKRGLMD